jgi:hypothetical protein
LLKLLLAVGIVLALAAGGWALFLRSTDDPGKTLTIGALEDGVKYSDQTLAEKQVAFAKQADLDALNITTAWTPGQTEPDPGELALLRGVADAAQKAGRSRASRRRPTSSRTTTRSTWRTSRDHCRRWTPSRSGTSPT